MMRRFIFGALIGAGVALLYAPATGARTRSMLRDKANKMGNDVTDFVDKKSRHMKNKMEGYKARARQFADQICERLPHESDGDMRMRDMATTAGEPSI